MDLVLDRALSNAVVAGVLALLVVAVGRWYRRPAFVHGLWLLVLLKLVTPPVWPVSIVWPDGWYLVESGSVAPSSADESTADSPQVVPEAESDDTLTAVTAALVSLPLERVPETASPGPPVEPAVALAESTFLPDLSWRPLLLTFWLTGSLLWLSMAAGRVFRFQALLRYASRAPADLQAQTQELAQRLGLAQGPTVWLVPGKVSPMLWAMGGSVRLLVPIDLWRRLDGEQQTTLLVHELAHLRRRDHWVRLLELVVSGLYWWHPVVWWARSQIRQLEETCCDAWVVWIFPQAARAYATALLETVDFLSEAQLALPPVASGFGQVHVLRRRLIMIMRGTTPRALNWGGLLAVLGLGAVLLPMLPTWAQTPQPAGRTEEQEQDRPGERAQRGREEGEQPEGDVRRAQEEVKRLQDQLRRMQEQMRAAEQRLRQAQERLRATERRRVEPPAAPPQPSPPAPPAAGRAGGGGFGRGGGGFGGPPGAPGFSGMRGGMGGAPADQNRRLQEVERKLDNVLRELENLRRELRQPPPGGPTRRGGGPARTEGPYDGPRAAPPATTGPGGGPAGSEPGTTRSRTGGARAVRRESPQIAPVPPAPQTAPVPPARVAPPARPVPPVPPQPPRPEEDPDPRPTPAPVTR